MTPYHFFFSVHLVSTLLLPVYEAPCYATRREGYAHLGPLVLQTVCAIALASAHAPPVAHLPVLAFAYIVRLAHV